MLWHDIGWENISFTSLPLTTYNILIWTSVLLIIWVPKASLGFRQASYDLIIGTSLTMLLCLLSHTWQMHLDNFPHGDLPCSNCATPISRCNRHMGPCLAWVDHPGVSNAVDLLEVVWFPFLLFCIPCHNAMFIQGLWPSLISIKKMQNSWEGLYGEQVLKTCMSLYGEPEDSVPWR